MSVLDEETVQQLLEDLPAELLGRLVTTFETDAGRLIGAMEDAAGQGDAGAWSRAAHGLAGAAGAIGARALMEMARRCMDLAQPDPLLPPVLRAQARASCGALRERIAAAP